MGKLVSYEVQVYQRGDWRIDSIANDRESAMESARVFEKSKHCPGVRVVEEVYDEDTQHTATKIVFRHNKSDGGPPAARRPGPRPAARRPTSPPKETDFRPRGHVAAPVKRDLGVNFAVATLLVLGTILAVGYFLAIRA